MRQNLSITALFTLLILVGCKNNSSTDNLLADAKIAADLECKIENAIRSVEIGKISGNDEEATWHESLALLKKKYKDDQTNFLAAVNKEMLNCRIEETEIAKLETVTKTTIIVGDEEDWNKMLDDYEAYTDEYVKLYKKALKGNNSAFAAYPGLLEKAEKLQQSMQLAQKSKKLGAAQIKRMTNIQAKMQNALLNN